MPDFCFGLFIFLCLASLWMLIGHGLWLMTAAFFRAVFGTSAPQRSDATAECLRCGRALRADSEHCTTCGLERHGLIAEELADLQATLRQLERFKGRGDMWSDERQRLAALVEARQLRLLGRMPRESEPAFAAVEAPPPLEAPVFKTPSVEIKPAEEPARAEVLPSAPPPEIVAPPVEAEVVDAIPIAAPPARSASEEDRPPALSLQVGDKSCALSEPQAEPPSIAASPEPPPPRPPRRSLGEVLAAFMEEKNILWGELIGGLLIVGCSVALVISLWQQLEKIPYFPFLVSGGITAALLGAGLYTFHHWKLESTSRGLLVIATLLVSLDYLVLAGLRVEYERQVLIDTAVSTLSLALFVLLLKSAGQVLMPEQRWLLPLAVLGPALGQLLTSWFTEPLSFPVFFLLGLVPTACQGLATAGLLRSSEGPEPFGASRAHRLFAFLGMATFALAAALGFLVFRNADLAQALPRLAPLVALAGIAPLACGLAVHERLAGNAALAGTRTAGTAVALTGMVVMLGAVVLAWPVPATTAVVCGLDFAVLTFVVFRHRLPVAHGAALPCLAVGYLTACYALFGPEQPFADWCFSVRGGSALVFLVLALTVAAEVLVRTERWVDGAYYAAGSGATALASLFLVTRFGGDVPGRVSLIYALYGAGSLALNRRWRQEHISYIGLGLLIAASLWVMFWLAPEQRPLWATVVAAEALLLGVVRTRTVEALPSYLGRPLAHVAEWTGLVALFLAIWPRPTDAGINIWAGEHVVTGACLTALYTLLTVVERRAILAWLSGAMILATVTAASGWAGTRWEAPHLSALIGLDLALAGSVLAVISIITDRRAGGVSPLMEHAEAASTHQGANAPRSPVLEWLATAWRATAAAALALALLLVVWSPLFPGPSLNAATLVTSALTALLLAWAFQAAALTWLGSVLLFAGLCHVLTWPTSERSVSRSLLLALLIQATLVLLGSLLLQARRLRQLVGAVAAWDTVHAIIAEPLRLSALLASVVAVPLVALPPRDEMLPFAGLVAWLAAFWLAVSWLERWPWVFTAFQAALSVAVVYAVTHWLEARDWVATDYPAGLLDPYSLQAYGIGLAFLGLVWTALRLSLPARGRLRDLLDFHKPALDELILAGLVLAQLGVACWNVLPGINQELQPATAVSALGSSMTHEHAFGGGAWALLALLALAVAAVLWQREPVAALFELLLLAVTVAVLSAGPFAAERASASALRWFLALCFFGVAIPLWLRNPLSNAAMHLSIRLEPDARPAPLLRTMLLFCCVLPVLILTFEVAASGFAGRSAAGPADGSFFASIGAIASNTVPLVLIALTLVGHGLRERAAGYVFAAGLLLNVTLMGGYALGVVQSGAALGDPQVVTMLQIGTLAAAVWALLWMLSQRWITTWRAASHLPGHSELITLQIGLGVVGNLVLLGGALAALALSLPLANSTEPVYSAATPWTMAIGSLLGWVALAASVGAIAYRRRQQGWPLNAWVLGALGLVLVAFLACNVARWSSPEAGYRALMLGAAGYALGCAALGLGRALRRAKTDEDVAPPSEPLTFWVQVSGGLAVALALKAAFWHQDQAWAAGALALASVAGAVTAVGRRREGWAFLAGLGLDLAAMLIVWHAHRGQPLDGWWIYLAQAGSSAAGLGALLWLAARKQLYGRLELRLSSSPLLAAQITLGMLGNLLVLGNAFLLLVFNPWIPATEVEQAGQAGGFALLLPMAAAFWYAVRTSLPRRFFLVASHALLLGVLAACTASPWDTTGTWLSYHILLVSWGTAGLLVLALGVVATVFETVAPDSDPDEQGAFLILFTRFLRHAVPEVQRWAEIIGLGVVLLSLRAVTDPSGPYWSAGGTLAVSLMSVGMALWSHRARHVYQSGLLFNLAGCLIWGAHASPTLTGFIAVNVLCLGIGSTFWSALHLTLAPRWGSGLSETLRFHHMAAGLGLGGLMLLVGGGLQGGFALTGVLPWAALLAVAVAMLMLLWDERAEFSGIGLYLSGLTTIGLVFQGHDWTPSEIRWAAAPVLAAYVWLASGVQGALMRWPGIRSTLRLPASPLPATWLAPLQTLIGCGVVGLSVDIALGFAAPESFAGPAAVLLLVPASVLLARRRADDWAPFLRQATLLLCVLAVAELGWAAMGPDAVALELHRGIVLMTALALMTGVCAVLPRWVPPPWSDSARQLGPFLHVTAVVAVAVILGLEIVHPELARQLAGWAIAAVAVALLWLIAAGLLYAVMPGRDPFHLSERGRTAYVYAGEVMLVLLGIHLKHCLPHLFTGRLAAYYALFLLFLALIGIGLAELFNRLKLRVLAEPLERTGLFLPVLPLLVFWLRPGLAGSGPFHGFSGYAKIWFLTACLYGAVAMIRRSFKFALIAALAANFGLWSLLFHFGQGFLLHPQLWLVPLALLLLISEHLNREHLPASQRRALRYTALGMIYLSSSADILLGGLGQQWWPPIALMLLAVAGMGLGVVLRVQAYLFLGACFLFLDVAALVWHAAWDRHNIWVACVFGIALGAGILAVVGLFEKRRDDMRRLLEQLKTWD